MGFTQADFNIEVATCERSLVGRPAIVRPERRDSFNELMSDSPLFGEDMFEIVGATQVKGTPYHDRSIHIRDNEGNEGSIPASFLITTHKPA